MIILARVTMLTLNDINRCISPHLLSPLSAIFDSKSNRGALVRTAAVLIIVHSENNIPHILLTRRSSKLKYHTGEISFPGGQHSTGEDQSLLDTALRETREEVGLCFEPHNVLGRLQTVYTLTSNFTIVPFITLRKRISEPSIFTNEVECIVDIPLQPTLAT